MKTMVVLAFSVLFLTGCGEELVYEVKEVPTKCTPEVIYIADVQRECTKECTFTLDKKKGFKKNCVETCISKALSQGE